MLKQALFSLTLMFAITLILAKSALAHVCPEFTTPQNAKLAYPQAALDNNPTMHSQWIYQEFTKTGAPSSSAVSAWIIRIKQYDSREFIDWSPNASDPERVPHLKGSRGVISIAEAFFTTSEGETVKVLGGLRPVQIIVPYEDTSEVLHDINSLTPITPLTAADKTWECAELGPEYPEYTEYVSNLPNGGPVASTKPPRSIFMKELRDFGLTEAVYDHNENPQPTIWRRGTELVLFANSDAGNYDNAIEYHFRDNGQVIALVGSSGFNNPGLKVPKVARTNHIHTVLWYVRPKVGDISPNDKVYRVEIDQRNDGPVNYNERFSKTPITTESAENFSPKRYRSWLWEDSKIINPLSLGRMGYSVNLITEGKVSHRIKYGIYNYSTMMQESDVIPSNDVYIRLHKSNDIDLKANLFNFESFMDGSEDISQGGAEMYAFTSVKHIPRNEDFYAYPKRKYVINQVCFNPPSGYDEGRNCPTQDPSYHSNFAPRAHLNRTQYKWHGIALTPRNIHCRTPFSQPKPGRFDRNNRCAIEGEPTVIKKPGIFKKFFKRFPG